MANAHTYFVGKDAVLMHNGKGGRQNHGSTEFCNYTNEEIKELLSRAKGKDKLKFINEQKDRGTRNAKKRKK